MISIRDEMDHREDELIFLDDFDADEIDRSIWNVRTTGPIFNHEQQAYIDSRETIYLDPTIEDAHGVLVIHPQFRPGFVTPDKKSFDFISGRIDTQHKFEFQYSIISARIKIPVRAGFWPAFWALGSSGEWPGCGEIDIMENVGDGEWASVAVHGPGYSGESGLVNKKYFLPEKDAGAWHIYTMDCRNPDELIFFIDGELVYRVTKPMVTFFGPWVFDGKKFLLLNFALGGTYPYKTNGVRFPYHGIPQETVDSMRSEEARMLVDWVKISKNA
jgi:beta-glucanase (GH16 family)